MRFPTIALASLSAALLVGSALTTASPPPAAAAPTQTTIDEWSELFIIKSSVVDDDRAYDGGPWSFGGIMRALAGNVPPDQFVEQWIRTLTNRTVVNGDTTLRSAPVLTLKDLAFEEFFDDWRQRSPGQTVDLDSAPFRLLAIVSRPDLLQVENGAITSAGEARFVFAAVDPSVEDVRAASSGARKFFVIFEYGIPASSCEELKAWHQQWHDLSQETLGSAAYKARLQQITDQFTLPVADSPAINGSLLNQLRTNEFALMSDSQVWDLREWNLVDLFGDTNLGLLQNVTTKQSPALRYLRTGPINATLRANMESWLNAERASILAGTHVVPDELNGFGFLGGIAFNDATLHIVPPQFGTGFPGDATFWWTPQFAPVVSPFRLAAEEDARVRHQFALQTCAGCHGWESGTDGVVRDAATGFTQQFSMTGVREYGDETTLSPFLTGTEVFPDKVNPVAIPSDTNGTGDARVAINHQFDDIERRVGVLRRILELDCGADGITVAEDIAAEMGTRVH